jgi:hypothetical protein
MTRSDPATEKLKQMFAGLTWRDGPKGLFYGVVLLVSFVFSFVGFAVRTLIENFALYFFLLAVIAVIAVVGLVVFALLLGAL